MNVLLLVSGDLWAGAESMVYQLARGLHGRKDVRPTLVCLNHGKLERLCRECGIDTHVLDEKANHTLRIVRKVVAIAGKTRTHVIHSHRYKENIIASMASALLDRPVLVTTLHGITEVKRWRPKQAAIALLEELCFFLSFDRIVCVSADLGNRLAQHPLLRRCRLATIHNGLEVNGRHEKGQRGAGRIRIGTAGRLVEVKDYPFLVQVAEYVCRKRENVSFLIAGDGPERDLLQQMIRERNMERNVELLGPVESMSGFYASLDIYVNTSKREGIPMTLLEASSYRLPSVALNVGGIGEIIREGENGLLVHGRDSAEFGERLITLIDHPDTRTVLGQGAFDTVRTRFSVQQMVEGYCRLYEAAWQEKKGAVNP